MKLNIGTLALAFVAALIVIRYSAGQPWTAWHIAGLAIALPAFVLFIMARLQLGAAFSIQAKASTLVTTGIYGRIRNPIYVFGGLMIAGGIIWAQRPWLLLVFVVLIPMQVLRTRKEEQVLEAKFGATYLAYKQKTWF
ncbi:MAG TPA: isoprenylcysteine carboxylmethyltransferase family protein [Terriglobales bacterium]|nr:isoprenylcysteine carboxylmethyltransferase family protein [Terriglobales bacterium]